MNNEIKINRYIIHLLEKQQKSKETNLDLSKEISKSDEFSIALVNEIHNSIKLSSSLKNTKFKDNNTNEFTNLLNDFLSTSEDNDFLKFSETIRVLENKLKKEFLALGGYYLFVDYEILGKRFISVILLRKKPGLNITKVGNIYKLNSSENLNIEKIAMAFRLNYEIYSSDDDRNYLALITTQQDGNISEYFKDWVNAGELIKDIKNTANLVKLIRSINLPNDLDEDGIRKYKSQNAFQKAVYEYAKSRKDSIINLTDLSKHFYGEDMGQTFLDFAAENNIIIDHEFKRNSQKWKSLVTIRAKTEGIELNVDFDKINEVDVIIKNNIITIHSPELVKQLNKQYTEKDKEDEE